MLGDNTLVVKNTYGISAVISPKVSRIDAIGEFGGSSLTRKKYPKKEVSLLEELLKKPLYQKGEAVKPKPEKLRSMSPRTKAKIRKKLIAFARIHKKLSFLTLTFCNEVEDKLAVIILAKFLENVNKRSKDFQYLWVAEKQSKNKVFKENIHFHIITNKYWDIKRWWQYWLDLQAKHGIVPREENYKPGSAFDVSVVNANNIKAIANYFTKYVTKNVSQFGCQLWNCSKKISHLHTDFYSGMSFIRNLERLQQKGQLGGEIKVYAQDFCNIHIIPLNRITLNFYTPIDEKNKEMWNGKQEDKNEVEGLHND